MRHRPRSRDHLAQRKRHAVREQLHQRECDGHGGDAGQHRRHPELAADRDDGDRDDHRGDDHDSELQLDRAEEVERPHWNPFVSSA
jgi:hypothetical protein